MKKLSTIIMALALVLGMSQCKKQETPTNGNSGEKVHITLNVNNGENISVNVDNGSRHEVAPNLGMIKFEDGDVLYVGHDGKYIGYLTYQNGAFAGDLEDVTNTADYLHFYFLGGKGPDVESIAENTTSFNISIADQSTNLPVLCYGHSTETYGSATNYSAVLEYQCALVKFNLNKATDYKCTLLNMPTEATISFATTAGDDFNPIAKTSTTDTIDLYREEGNTGVRWAILLPGTNLSADGNVSGAPSGTLNANQFINSGISLKNPVFAAPGADYAVKTSGGVLTQFSVSSTQKVYFSRANLKCNAANPDQPVWGFHEYQYDECPGFGTINSTSGTGTSGIHITSSNEMDRFSWGFHSSTPVSEEDWVDGSRNLNWNDGTDWGCALKGTAYGNYWRTLTAAEWKYLLNTRSGKRFLRATWTQMHPVNSQYKIVNGIFIAPDGYNGGSTSSWTEWNKANKFRLINSTVVTELLDAGCVFLPALGYRQGSYYYEYNYHYQNGWYMYGNYWTATGVEQQPNSAVIPQATAFRFEDDNINYAYYPQRDLGMPVRLVWDAN
ncbi:MAG: hypothetical protein IKH61_12025 [Bacteroidales bacterium]|nr:hypothetical protein [Bacteroidales bacterium]